MEETDAQRDDDLGPIAMPTWRETPCVRERTATEDDAKAGRAAFYLALSERQESRPIDLDLPRCAVLHDENEGDLPVIVIQAEEGNNGSGAVEGHRRLSTHKGRYRNLHVVSAGVVAGTR